MSQIIYPGPGQYNQPLSQPKDFSAGNWGTVKGIMNAPVPRKKVTVVVKSPKKTAVKSFRKMKMTGTLVTPKLSSSVDKPLSFAPNYFGQDVGNVRLKPAQSIKFLSAQKKSSFDTPAMRNSQHLGPGQFHIKHVDEIQYAELSNVHVPFGSSKERCRIISSDISSQVERLRREKLKKAFLKSEKTSPSLRMEMSATRGSATAYDPFKWFREKPGGMTRLVEISNRLCELDSSLDGVIKLKKGKEGSKQRTKS